MNNKFAILTASSNKYPYLDDWMNSILAQKYRPLEVVMVDDCSDDKTRKLIKRFRKRFGENDIEFQYLRNSKRLHCSNTYRVAIKNATGDFMGVLDADDMLVDDSVEYIMSKYKQYENIAWIYTQFSIYDANMKYIKNGFCRMPTAWGSMLDSGERRKQVYSHWRTFSRRCSDLEDVLPEGLRCAVDKYMGYKLEELGNGMFIDRVCYRYRQGVKRGIVAKESTKNTWKKLVKDIVVNRKKYNIKPYPIIEGEA
jgi:glycosyltransferase involved in cell wall biosynthesis